MVVQGKDKKGTSLACVTTERHGVTKEDNGRQQPREDKQKWLEFWEHGMPTLLSLVGVWCGWLDCSTVWCGVVWCGAALAEVACVCGCAWLSLRAGGGVDPRHPMCPSSFY